ncbi:MAG: Chromosomal replication initiator protein DnaA [Candidatus Peregrinibacteria bacterium GW2011_GWA2_47_7]|nr:MAG: Chromosomal replication initiator protein DnaA [Candidatus Peregrinibacteria bacterium GW2011_GWA2_47_7]
MTNPCLLGEGDYNKIPMDTKELWRQILLRIYPTLRHDQFITWFADTTVLRVDGHVMVVGVPSQFAYSWIAKHYTANILEAGKTLNPAITEVSIVVDPSLTNADDTKKVSLESVIPETKKVRKLPRKQEVKIDDDTVSYMLNPNYQLHNFIVGKHNRLVHAACLAVGSNPGAQWNPLFIYGGVGLGKTHLCQATGREILKNHPDKIVVYLTAERFLNEVVDAIKKYNAQDFKARYRNVDCLIIDDIQLLADKDRTQEEFFHLFNELYNANKQIIISSDRPPKELAGIETRLQSRFEMGMVAEVHFPDYEKRLAILQNKCAEQQLFVAPEVLDFIAYNVHHSVRELEGVLMQASAQMRLENITPTVKSVGGILRKLDRNGDVAATAQAQGNSSPDNKSSIRSADDVINLVADYYRIPSSELRGPSRKREIMLPRQLCMYLIYEVLGHSYDTIGDYFSGRNHTTVLHSYNKVKSRIGKDSKMLQDIHSIKKEMGL